MEGDPGAARNQAGACELVPMTNGLRRWEM